MQLLKKSVIVLFVFFVASCNQENKKPDTTPTTTEVKKTPVKIPDFNADTAFAFVKNKLTLVRVCQALLLTTSAQTG
ncbi:MAG: hypothetical protein IPJ79_02250 [Bacteroidetes bacterium]|nr:hypothetical protein [Bacteroidota bacterium]